MSETLTIRLSGDYQRQRARRGVDKAPDGYEVVFRPISKKRKADQNAKFHAMISDFHKQAFRGYQFDCLKAVLVSQFAAEKEEIGEPLRHPGATTWDWKRQCPVYVRPSTTDFTTKEAGEFIEYLYAEGNALDIQWSEPALAAYEDYREAQAA